MKIKFRRSSRQITSWILVLLILLGNITLTNKVFAVKDVTSLLEPNLVMEIWQDGVLINDNGELDSLKPIVVRMSMKVPVKGDDYNADPSTYVEKGDTANFNLSSAFTVLGGSVLPLTFSGVDVGTVEFKNDPSGSLVDIVFSGDDDVFNGGYSSVECAFNGYLEFDPNSKSVSIGETIIKILDKQFKIIIDADNADYTITKTGTVDKKNQKVDWSIEVGGTFGPSNIPIDLKGFTFRDDLSGVGDYIDGSFGYGAPVNHVDPVYAGDILSYTFPDSTISPQTVVFSTRIPDDKFYAVASVEQTIPNEAAIFYDGKEMTKDPAEVKLFPDKWIEKTGTTNDDPGAAEYDPTNRTITWTITANQQKKTLENVIITDMLAAGLTWEAAEWGYWDDITSTYIKQSDLAQPPSNEYVIGDIDDQIRLIITAKVDDDSYVTHIDEFYNEAFITWDGLAYSGVGSGSIGVPIGYPAIIKTSSLKKPEGTIKWSFVVDAKKQINMPMPLTVYDLLIHGASLDPGWTIDHAVPIDLTKLTPRFDQKYVDLSFVGAGLTITRHDVKDSSNNVVGDLLVIEGMTTNDTEYSFSFDTYITNPDIILNNGQSTIQNTASLFGNNIYLDNASAATSYSSNILEKEMIEVKNGTDFDVPDIYKNDRTNDANKGFNYKDKSVIFVLNVNADGVDISNRVNENNEQLGNVTVKDTLPVDWEFVDFPSGDKFLIFDGSVSNGSSITATNMYPSPVGNPPLKSSLIAGNEATFEFEGLDKKYIILVKARPIAAKIKEYFEKNGEYSITNEVNLVAEKWPKGAEEKTIVDFKSNILDKYYTHKGNGVIEWTVEYQPYDIQHPNLKIEDTIPVGLELRRDSSGNLIIGGNIEVVERALNLDGTSTEGLDVANDPGVVSYDPVQRILTIVVPKDDIGYRISYITDITGDPGVVQNSVILSGDDISFSGDPVDYIILEADSSATMKKNGNILIRKQDGLSTDPLPDTEFTIFRKVGVNYILYRVGQTNASGEIVFMSIPPGTYYFQETAAPVGFVADPTMHTLEVVDMGGGEVRTKVDGREHFEVLPQINIKNYKNLPGSIKLEKVMGLGTSFGVNHKHRFKITFRDSGGNIISSSNVFNYLGYGGAHGGVIATGGIIELEEGQWVVILGLEQGMRYEIEEIDYLKYGYDIEDITAPDSVVGSVVSGEVAAATREIQYKNKREVDSITINKTISGNGAGTNGAINEFEYTFTLKTDTASPVDVVGSFHYTITGGGSGPAGGVIKSGEKFRLEAGANIKIDGIPVISKYKFVENNYSINGYDPIPAPIEGVIGNGGPIVDNFNNNRDVGNIEITKLTVRNEDGHIDILNKFKFTVNLRVGGSHLVGIYAYEIRKTGDNSLVSSGTIESGNAAGNTFELEKDQKIIILNIPVNATFTITETDYRIWGYSLDSLTTNGGSISGDINNFSVTGNTNSGQVQEASFSNKRNVGNIKISKATVRNRPGNASILEEFEYTFSLTTKDAPIVAIEGLFHYDIIQTDTSVVLSSGIIKHNDTFVLENNQSIVIKDIPYDAVYKVTEKDYTLWGYELTGIVTLGSGMSSNGASVTGQTNGDGIKHATYTNTRNVGHLEISKVLDVDSYRPESNKEFTYSFSLRTSANQPISGTFNYLITYADSTTSNGTIANGGTFKLKEGDKIEIYDLPVNAKYSVVEYSYVVDGYRVSGIDVNDAANMSKNEASRSATGSTNKDLDQTVKFANLREVGDLKVSKLVTGLGGEVNKKFAFTISFTDVPLPAKTYEYNIYRTSDGVKIGGPHTVNSVGANTIELEDGQYALIEAIPKNVKYTVVETDYYAQGYKPNPSNGTHNGTIEYVDSAGVVKNADFVNRTFGTFKFEKKISGLSYDNRDFKFRVIFSDNGTYPYTKSDGTTGTIASGGTIELKGDQHIVLEEVDVGVLVTVEEYDVDGTAFLVDPVSKEHQDVIVRGVEKSVTFTNTTIGHLVLTKTVSGIFADLNKKFKFDIEFDDALPHAYTSINGGPSGTITTSGTIELSDGQGIEFANLPAALNYRIEEHDYVADGYMCPSFQRVTTGSITLGNTDEINYLNSTIGKLKIEKILEGDQGNIDYEFEFKVTMTGVENKSYGFDIHKANHDLVSSGNITFDNAGILEGIKLKAGQYIIIHHLPCSEAFTVVETDHYNDGYKLVEKTGDVGNIVRGEIKTATFTNKTVGHLEIEKLVDDIAYGDVNDIFEFTITMTDSADVPLAGTYWYNINGGLYNNSITLDAFGSDTIELKHNDVINLIDLPPGTKYTITETDPYNRGYLIDLTPKTGVININTTTKLLFTNNTVGHLKVEKIVAGNAGDLTKDFEFVLELLNSDDTPHVGKYENYDKDGNKNPVDIGNGDTFKLKGAESILITKLPTGVKYKITETDYINDGYITSPSLIASGTIVKANEANAKVETFTNTKDVGYLEITKEVDGFGSDPNKSFTFTIDFDDTAPHDYTGLNGGPSGTIASTGTFVLKHGQGIRFGDLPVGVKYTVTENDYFVDGYYTDPTTRVFTGNISLGITDRAEYVNTMLGKLEIRKELVGEKGDNNFDFEFKITMLDAASKTFAYEIFNNDNTLFNNGNINFNALGESDTIKLKNGQYIVIHHLPSDASFIVTESDHYKDGYKQVLVVGDTGVIKLGEKADASFTNQTIGHLEFEKFIDDVNFANANDDFEFTITMTDSADVPLVGTYWYNLNAGVFDKSITLDALGSATVELKHGDVINIRELPPGTKYSITETDSYARGYLVDAATRTGEIDINTKDYFLFTNKAIGYLKLEKFVAGNGGDLTKKFTFTITFSDGKTYPYKGSGVADGVLASGTTIDLAHGESILFEDLPAGLGYTIIENDYVMDGYFTTRVDDVGTISLANTSEARFTNTRNIGDLEVTKTVIGVSAKLFKFTVDFVGANFLYDYYIDGVYAGQIASGGSFHLAHGQKALIKELPSGTTYKVTEDDYFIEGYVTSSIDETGVIATGLVSTAAFANLYSGDLVISKTVGGISGSKTMMFEFAVNLSTPGPYDWEDSQGNTGTITSGDKIYLSHGQTFTIYRVIHNTSYEVIETNYSWLGYVTTSTEASGNIVAGEVKTAAFTNTNNIYLGGINGNLSVTKTTLGATADKNKKFDFTITFDSPTPYYYTGVGVSGGKISSGDKISLAHGQSITILGLPVGISYSVTEDDYSAAGYVTSMTGDTGKIIADTTVTAAFENTKDVFAKPIGKNFGSLNITKTVKGEEADPDYEFMFTILFDNDETYSYIGSGVADGNIRSGDRIGLSHGQSILIEGIPAGTKYQVIEDDYAGINYTVESENAVGVIEDGEVISADFINTHYIFDLAEKEDKGNLTLKKTVKGEFGETNRDFTFIITFSDSKEYSYSGSKSGTIVSGQSVKLKHNEFITIEGLPYDTEYEIVEKEDGKEGYITQKINSVGIIEDEELVCEFINTRSGIPQTADLSQKTLYTIGLIASGSLLVIFAFIFFYNNKRRGFR